MRQFVAIILVAVIISAYPMQMSADEEVGIFADPDKTAPDSSSVSEGDSINPDSINAKQQIYSSQYMKGMEDAVRIAKGNKNKLFFFSGFCLGAIGVVLPFIITYDAPMTYLRNKPNDYIIGFKDKYNSTLRSENGKLAVIGLVTYLGAGAVLYLFYIIMMIATFPTY